MATEQRIAHEGYSSEGFKFTRREAVIGGAALLAGGAFLGAKLGGGDRPQSHNDVAQVPNDIEDVAQQSSGSEKLNINIENLPKNELLYADREERNPERIRDIFDNGTREEFLAIYQTEKSEILTDGEFDLQKSYDVFLAKLEAALLTFLDEKSLAPYINDLNDGSFARDMAINDLDIVRGLGGYEDHRYTDEEVTEMNLYQEFTAAHQVLLNRYIRNAQRDGGDLNETVKVKSRAATIRKQTDTTNAVMYNIGITNVIDKDNPPHDPLAVEGLMNMAVYHKSKESDLAIYTRSNEWGPADPSPLEKLAETRLN